jgi:integrase
LANASTCLSIVGGQVGPEQWALHVPLGKLHTERLVPLDSEGLRLIERILELRALASPARLAKSEGFLLPRVGGRFALFQTLREAMADFAKRAGCVDSSPLSPHRLRHTWATEMLLCGMTLPALMQLMGHKDIRMTLRYLKVTQPDLQREFHKARQNTAEAYSIPSLAVPAATADIPGVRHALRPHAIFWKCIDASSPMTRPVAAYSVSIDASWMSINNFRT